MGRYTGDPAEADWRPSPGGVTALSDHEGRVFACVVGFAAETGGYNWQVDAPEDQRGRESLPDRPTAIGHMLRQGHADTEEAARAAAWKAVPGTAVVLAYTISWVRGY